MQATKDLDGARLQWKADGKSWSVNDILAHLRSCADLWTHSIYAMLAENEPAFSDINERKWAKVTRYAELSFIESLQVYSLQRKKPRARFESSAIGILGKSSNHLYPGAQIGKT